MTTSSKMIGGGSLLAAPRKSMRICMFAYPFYENDTRILHYASALVERGDTVGVVALSRCEQEKVRPPTSEADYHNTKGETHLQVAIDFLHDHPEAKIVLLPRMEKQVALVRRAGLTFCPVGKL
jgi:hypothetical protein